MNATAAFVAGVFAVVGACSVGACASGSGAETVVQADGLAVVDAWVRPTPAGTDTAAFYVTIENRAAPDDRLIGASSDHCMVVTPHVTEVDGDGVAAMRDAPGDRLDLGAGQRVTMDPFGLHLMCLGLTAPLTVDDRPTVELRFAAHTPIAVQLAVEQR